MKFTPRAIQNLKWYSAWGGDAGQVVGVLFCKNIYNMIMVLLCYNKNMQVEKILEIMKNHKPISKRTAKGMLAHIKKMRSV